MFTVELEQDHKKVVTIDPDGKFEDVEVYTEEDGTIYVRQFAEDLEEYQLLIISHHQLTDIVNSLDAPEGAHAIKMGGM
tara:strand:- start:2085 stop:2321 length:237 start_codon:yes stop_codon:yes gene_type:complete